MFPCLFNFLTPNFLDITDIESWLCHVLKYYTENGLIPATKSPLSWLGVGLMNSLSCFTNCLYLGVLTMEKDCVTVLKAASSKTVLKRLVIPEDGEGRIPGVFLWFLKKHIHTPWSFPMCLPVFKFSRLLWYLSYWDKVHPKATSTIRIFFK